VGDTQEGERIPAVAAADRLRICLIVEERYKDARMPTAVGEQLAAWGHEVTVLELHETTARLVDLFEGGDGGHDVYVLKTVSEGPGQSVIEAAAAFGIITVNDARAIRSVRDKAVAAATARANGIPFPVTYFLAHPALLTQVPAEHYPLVVKPANGSENRGIHLVATSEEAVTLAASGAFDGDGQSFLLAQPYMPNDGDDVKVYNAGGRIFAVRRPSPLSGRAAEDELMEVSPELRGLMERIGRVFNLDIYGVDVVKTPEGWVAVDINDFPSFSMHPDAVEWVASTIVEVARRKLSRPSTSARQARLRASRTATVT
jgi:ribosomal protein S6--L-glutamate ligase